MERLLSCCAKTFALAQTVYPVPLKFTLHTHFFVIWSLKLFCGEKSAKCTSFFCNNPAVHFTEVGIL